MATLDVINPATGKRIASLRADDAASISAKTAAAREAQGAWAATPLRARLDVMRRFREAIVRRTDALAQTLTDETGKPITQSRNELRGLLPRIDFFLEETPRALRPEAVLSDAKAGLRERITWEPLGVVVNISAWNYPYFVSCNVLLPALLAGNAVLYKPSEFASRTGLALVDTLHASGVPRDVITAVIGAGEAGTALVKQDVEGVFFTGSYGTGRKIARAVAGRMVKLQLELGGKDPVYVCDDVEIATAAASAADGAFYNNGQSCCSIERLYVHERVFEPFLEAFVRTVKGFKVGHPRRDATYIGPLTRSAQIAVLEAQVADAIAKGARVVLGGAPVAGKRNVFAPTVLIDVNHRMAVMRDESFGPIIGIIAVRDDDEAVELMNDTKYGLTAGVYSRDQRRAEAILARVHSGSAYWNCCDRVSPRLPWSGVGHSGVGVTLSRAGIQTFTRPKAWHLKTVG
jgi:acyl-CoA reductase-like NAD-dependent aldehyde dehydrogenase